MHVEALTRNKPVVFQHVVQKQRTRMLEIYRIWQNPYSKKKNKYCKQLDKMRSEQNGTF